jgi:hypothetical protein
MSAAVASGAAPLTVTAGTPGAPTSVADPLTLMPGIVPLTGTPGADLVRLIPPSLRSAVPEMPVPKSTACDVPRLNSPIDIPPAGAVAARPAGRSRETPLVADRSGKMSPRAPTAPDARRSRPLPRAPAAGAPLAADTADVTAPAPSCEIVGRRSRPLPPRPATASSTGPAPDEKLLDPARVGAVGGFPPGNALEGATSGRVMEPVAPARVALGRTGEVCPVGTEGLGRVPPATPILARLCKLAAACAAAAVRLLSVVAFACSYVT